MTYTACKAIAYSLFLIAFLLGASSTMIFDMWINQGPSMKVVGHNADPKAYVDSKALYSQHVPQPMSRLAAEGNKRVASASCCR